jgi:hypothetical protein
VGVPRALKNVVNKEQPLQISLPPNYPERVYIGIINKSQCIIENAWSFHINTPMSANIGPLIDQQDRVWFITK